MSSRAFAYRRAAERRLIYALVIVLAAMIMLPFLWLLLMSFKTNDDIFAFPPKLLFTPTLENYAGLWASSFRYSFLNSAVVVGDLDAAGPAGRRAGGLCAVAHVDAAGEAAIAADPGLAHGAADRLHHPLLPGLPLDGAARHQLGLILIYLTFNLSLVIWLMRSFFDACPRSLEEAAWIDGATLWQGFTSIMLPISGPGVAATAILCFLFGWNDFFFALILTRNQAMTAPVAVVNFMNYEGWEWGKIAAGGTMVMLPVLIFSMLVRKFLIQRHDDGSGEGMNYPTGKTHLLMLIADPVAHVRAAQFVNPIFERKGLDAFLVPVHVRSAELADVVPRLGKLGNVRGLIITIPHKERMARLCSELGPNAKMAGAVNVARVEPGGRLVGEMFDGEGLVATAKTSGIDYKGRRVLILGAGGAGRAVAFAMAQEGAGEISHPQSHGGACTEAGSGYQDAPSQGGCERRSGTGCTPQRSRHQLYLGRVARRRRAAAGSRHADTRNGCDRHHRRARDRADAGRKGQGLQGGRRPSHDRAAAGPTNGVHRHAAVAKALESGRHEDLEWPRRISGAVHHCGATLRSPRHTGKMGCRERLSRGAAADLQCPHLRHREGGRERCLL